MDRQAAKAVQQLLQADASGKGGASIKSLTLAPSIDAKKATHAVTCQTLKLLPVLKQLLEGCSLLQQHPQLQPETAYVLVYEVLFGEGLRRRGPAERAVMAAKGDIKMLLEDIKIQAGELHQGATMSRLLPVVSALTVVETWPHGGEEYHAGIPRTTKLSVQCEKMMCGACHTGVKDVEGLLSSEVQRMHEQPRPRTARVNTLKMSVADAVAWLSSPPQEHGCQPIQVRAVLRRFAGGRNPHTECKLGWR